ALDLLPFGEVHAHDLSGHLRLDADRRIRLHVADGADLDRNRFQLRGGGADGNRRRRRLALGSTGGAVGAPGGGEGGDDEEEDAGGGPSHGVAPATRLAASTSASSPLITR